jgi:preprotein translocase subunit SecG
LRPLVATAFAASPERREELEGVLLNATLIVIHLLVSVVLILFVLLHAGRGGGLSDMFGGAAGGGAMAGSTVVEKNLDRLTVIAAVIFAFTTILLSLRLT